MANLLSVNTANLLLESRHVFSFLLSLRVKSWNCDHGAWVQTGVDSCCSSQFLWEQDPESD